MQINFYPEYDNPDFERAAKEYAAIWEKEGERIIAAIEKISGLKFKEKIINAITYGRLSQAFPLQLNSLSPIELRKGDLIHELCHRLLRKNNIKWEKIEEENASFFISHRPLDLILYDIWVELYGEEFPKKQIEFEINEWTGDGISPYEKMWDWALEMTKEQRHEKFQKYLES